MNEDTKLPKHSVSSGFSMENTVMREGGSSGRSGVRNSRDDVLELAPVETRASRGSKLLKESPRFSDTRISRSTGNSLHNEMENGSEVVGLKSAKDSNGEIEGEIRVEKEEELPQQQQQQQQQAAAVAAAVVVAAGTGTEEEESNGNEMDAELAAKQKSQSEPLLREDEIGNEKEAEMESESSQETKKKADDESETNQKKTKGVGTIDKKALLVIGDEIAAEESSKMNRVDDDKMEDEDKIQEEEKEKDKNIERDRINREEKEKIKLDSEEVARKAKNLAKLYNDINSEIQHIVNRDKSLFQKDPALATKQSGGELGKGGQSMSTASLSNLRNDGRGNAPSNADPVASNPNSIGLQRMNELENRANAMSDSHAHNPMNFDQQEEESLEKSTGNSKRSPVYYEKSGYRRRPMQTESFQYSVNHVSLYPSFLEIGITSNFDGVSYCSVFDRKGRTLCSLSHASQAISFSPTRSIIINPPWEAWGASLSPPLSSTSAFSSSAKWRIPSETTVLFLPSFLSNSAERLVTEPIDRHMWNNPNQLGMHTSVFRVVMIIGVIVVILFLLAIIVIQWRRFPFPRFPHSQPLRRAFLSRSPRIQTSPRR